MFQVREKSKSSFSRTENNDLRITEEMKSLFTPSKNADSGATKTYSPKGRPKVKINSEI